MSRHVQVQPRAKLQIYEAALWWAEHRSLEDASRWLDGIESSIQSLADDAERFPLAAETQAFEFPLRQMNFGISGRPTHRILFAVFDERVVVYTVRHLARQDLTLDDID